MRLHQWIGWVWLIGTAWVAGAYDARAQSPADVESQPSVTDPTPASTEGTDPWLPEGDDVDAASRGLRSLYVPGGLTSDRAVQEVMRTSPDVQRTRSLGIEARGSAVQAMAGLVPQVEASGRATRLNPVPTRGIGGDSQEALDQLIGQLQDPAAQQLWTIFTSFEFPALTSQYSFDASLTYSFTDSLARALPAYRAAKDNKEAAAQQLEAELNNVAFDARSAYYEFARAKAGVGVAESAVDAAEAQVRETSALVGAGAAARVDLMRVEAQLEAANVALERAKLTFQVAERTLQVLMHTNEKPTLGEDLSLPVTGIPPGDEETLKERAFEGRPDLQALYTYVDATRHQLRSANGGRAPDILVRGNAFYSNPNLRVVPQEQRFQGTWEVSAILRWSPNETIDAQGRSKQLQAALERAYADVISLGDAIRVEVAEGYHGVQAAQAALKSARLGLTAAEEGYRVKREQLRAGIVNTTDLLQAQTDLIRAQVDVVDSAVGLRIAKAQLLRAIGERP